MTKKRIGTMAACLALVGAVAVGGTLALLSAQSNDVTNTFTVGSGYNQEEDPTPDFYLDEAPIVKDVEGENLGGYNETTGTRVKANTYADLVEGTTLAKDPQFHIDDECEVKYSWIVAKITGFNATEDAETKLDFNDVTDETEGLTGTWYHVTKNQEGVYDYEAVTNENKTAEMVNNGVYIYSVPLQAGESTKDLFQSLTVTNVKEGEELSNMVISGWAVEGVYTTADGVDTPVEFEQIRDDVMTEIDGSVFAD